MRSDQHNTSEDSPAQQIESQRFVQCRCIPLVATNDISSRNEDQTEGEPETTVTGKCSCAESIASLKISCMNFNLSRASGV
jgi:hypothetical protein